EGRVVVSAVERLMGKLPGVPEKESPTREQRRADAMVAICSAKVAEDPDPDRATVVVHVPVQVLWGEELGNRSSVLSSDQEQDEPGCALEGGGVVSGAVARRLACDARIETVL